MRQIHISFVAIFFCIIYLSSCSKGGLDGDNTVKTVGINLSDVRLIPIEQQNILSLETNDSSVIYDICALATCNDTLIIQSRDLIKAFNRKDGKYLYDISKVGQGPGEYQSILQFWNKEDSLYLLSFGSRKIFKYLADGSYIGNDLDFNAAEEIPVVNYIVDAPGRNGYFIINCYKGGLVSNPKYSFISSDFNDITDVPGCELKDGSYTPDRMITDNEKGKVLSWEQLRDTLYTVDISGQHPLYAFDFGDNKFPDEYQAYPEFYRRVEEFTRNKTSNPYASFIKYYQPYGDYLFFSFMTSDAKAYIAEYNEKDDRIVTFSIHDPSGRFVHSPFFKIDGENLLIALTDKVNIEANPLLYTFPISEIPR